MWSRIGRFSGLWILQLWVWIYRRVRSTLLDLDIGIQIKDLHLFQPGVNKIGYGIEIIQTLFVSLLIGGGIYFLESTRVE